VEVLNGAAIISGKMNLGKSSGISRRQGTTTPPLSWTPVGADVSASGDLGYTYWSYEFRSAGKNGKPVVENGKYTSLWKMQMDGSWRAAGQGNASAAQ
jgi:ketosteroid isomerase-like protein